MYIIIYIYIYMIPEKKPNQSVDWPNCKCHKASHVPRGQGHIMLHQVKVTSGHIKSQQVTSGPPTTGHGFVWLLLLGLYGSCSWVSWLLLLLLCKILESQSMSRSKRSRSHQVASGQGHIRSHQVPTGHIRSPDNRSWVCT